MCINCSLLYYINCFRETLLYRRSEERNEQLFCTALIRLTFGLKWVIMYNVVGENYDLLSCYCVLANGIQATSMRLTRPLDLKPNWPNCNARMYKYCVFNKHMKLKIRDHLYARMNGSNSLPSSPPVSLPLSRPSYTYARSLSDLLHLSRGRGKHGVPSKAL